MTARDTVFCDFGRIMKMIENKNLPSKKRGAKCSPLF